MTGTEAVKYSISEVAQMAGVSPSTVSRAISGKKGVGRAQREKILELAEKLGYHPNSHVSQSHAKAGSVSFPGMIALIVGDILNPFYSYLEYNIQKALYSEGYQLVVFNSEYDVEREMNILNMTDQFRFAGIMMVTAQSRQIEKVLSSVRIPKVLVNRNLPLYEGDSVLTDNFQAGYLAAMHLIDLYHRRIGFVRGPQASSASSQRFEGFRQALSNFSLELDDAHVFDCNLSFESGQESAEAFLALPEENRPSAIIIGNDISAMGFIDVVRKHGLSIPEDLSVVSFDNVAVSSVEGISLTSVSQHVEEMAHEAARLMLKQLGGDTSHPERIIISPELIVRKTTAQYKA